MKLKITSLILTAVLLLSICLPASASNPGLCEGVTEEMCSPDYWKNTTLTGKDKVLMTDDDIEKFNKSAVDSKNTYVMGIDTMSGTYNADKVRRSSTVEIPSRDLYIGGEKIDKEAYYGKINTAILETGYTETEKNYGYALCVKGTNMRALPTLDVIGYSASETDDEMVSESLTVNEPFLIRGECTIDGVKFYSGYSLDCAGWVCADDFAVCRDMDEWLDAWKFDTDGKDFLVVTQDEIMLEPDFVDDYASNLVLYLSTALKLVPENEIPSTIGDGRNSWNNYVVYVPTRNSEGMYEPKVALIPQHYSVNIGYLPFTQSNVLDIAFTCLGDEYGWAGFRNLYDCSLYTRTIYRCFCVFMPRNTTWQQNVDGTKITLSGMTDEEKQAVLETLPAGSVLFISGHTMMYLGTVNGVGYVISDLGSVVEPSESDTLNAVHSVAVTPLSVRRSAKYNYITWLSSLVSAVMVMPKNDINSSQVSAAKDDDGDVAVRVSYCGKELTEGIHYSVSIDGSTVTVNGLSTFDGSVTAETRNHTHSFEVTAKSDPTCTAEGRVTYTCSDCGYSYTEKVSASGHASPDENGICPVCGAVADENLYNSSLLKNAVITVPDSNMIYVSCKALLTASSSSLPEGYSVVWYDGDTAVSDGGTFTTPRLGETHTYTAEIVDANGNAVSTASQNRSVTVFVRNSFFDRIISLFRIIFGKDVTVF